MEHSQKISPEKYVEVSKTKTESFESTTRNMQAYISRYQAHESKRIENMLPSYTFTDRFLLKLFNIDAWLEFGT
ncbi:CLUMA_CG005350, isoform A [Clunio marinus]|uniref:CLUMA_CG005350, isoform A n=1 Tax=Clunio marinus TaxID=568069 RepID=A0A1J1HUF7_9DIPT|nr:CLUMA_CG005350, isoform A [Clunio marinus]